MDELLLKTKFHIPSWRTTLVPRLHLIQRLNEGMSRTLTLIAAPAGYGKTTAISMWIPQNKYCVAWLSLDERDDDPIQFWTYLVAALQTLKTNLGENARTFLPALEQDWESTEAFLTALINEISAFPDEFALVLDDYHVINAHTIHKGMAYLLGHAPENFHLVVSSRAEPPLPIPRLRARNQMIELRADDLRFTIEEVAIFLNEVMELNLSPDNIASLEARTEGWIAGLQLAALSMQRHSNTEEFITSFMGSQRFILDYLVDEVLQNQPKEVRSFLLETSILDRFNGSLCEAVTEQTGGRAMLERLEQKNLFIVSLDDQQEWFRYQHLFADVLRVRLQQDTPERISELHRRAAAWLEANGTTLEAIGHALTSKDYQRAFHLITILNQSEPMVLLQWIRTLPDELVRSQPELSIQKAYALLAMKRFTDAEVSLQEAERNAKGDFLVLGKVAVARATVGAVRGESEWVIELARLAQMYLPEEERFQRGTLGMSLGIAYRLKGDTGSARQALVEAASPDRSVGNLVAVTAICELGRLEILEGHLHQASDRYQQALTFASEKDGSFLPVAGRAFINLGRLYYEWGDFDLASRFLTLGIQYSQDWWLLSTLIEGYIGLAHVRNALGDLEGRDLNLSRAEQSAKAADIAYLVAIAAATQAKLLVGQGDLDASTPWAMAQMGVLDENFVFTEARYCEHVALARWLIACGRLQPTGQCLSAAIRLLQRLQREVERTGLTGLSIEIRMLMALSQQAHGNAAQAASQLVRLLALAEPEGYLRLFVDEGEPMHSMLTMCQLQIEEQSPPLRPYLKKILSSFSGPEAELAARVVVHSQHLPQQVIRSGDPDLVEAPSERELEVLQLLAGGLSTRQIADTLVITTGTVRNHLKSIYSKLDVHSRVQAVERARMLNLFK
jgi:LuxR family maltose regulon positive regulatory protein